MTTINTLVQDIYKLLESGAFKIDGTKLGEMLEKRLGEERTPSLSMSNFGKPCTRDLWFRINRPDLANPLDGPTRLKFLIGDIIEEVVLSLAEQTPHKVTGRQDELTLHGMRGHRDAVIDGVVVDVKSANSRSFDKFDKHTLSAATDSFGYLDQLSLYTEASAEDPEVKVKTEAAFLAVDKELGRIVLDRHKKRPIAKADIDAKRKMLAQPEPPKCFYEIGPRGGIPWQCQYCQFKDFCHSDEYIRLPVPRRTEEATAPAKAH